MATETQYYQLDKPDYSDQADVAVINGNMDIIDNAIHEMDSRVVIVETEVDDMTGDDGVINTGEVDIKTSMNQSSATNISSTLLRGKDASGTTVSTVHLWRNAANTPAYDGIYLEYYKNVNGQTVQNWFGVDVDDNGDLMFSIPAGAGDEFRHTLGADSNGVWGVGVGGTGKATHTANSVLVGNGTSAVKNINSNTGAFYSTSSGGQPQFGTLPIAQGGTGLTASPSMVVNLASTGAANILAASPRPGVTGTLPIANGGTGATTAASAKTALGIVDYTAGTGISISSGKIGHSNSVAASTIGQSSATQGATIAIPYATYDKEGHITTKGTHTHTISSLAASAISSGTFAAARIPDLSDRYVSLTGSSTKQGGLTLTDALTVNAAIYFGYNGSVNGYMIGEANAATIARGYQSGEPKFVLNYNEGKIYCKGGTASSLKEIAGLPVVSGSAISPESSAITLEKDKYVDANTTSVTTQGYWLLVGGARFEGGSGNSGKVMATICRGLAQSTSDAPTVAERTMYSMLVPAGTNGDTAVNVVRLITADANEDLGVYSLRVFQNAAPEMGVRSGLRAIRLGGLA